MPENWRTLSARLCQSIKYLRIGEAWSFERRDRYADGQLRPLLIAPIHGRRPTLRESFSTTQSHWHCLYLLSYTAFQSLFLCIFLRSLWTDFYRQLFCECNFGRYGLMRHECFSLDCTLYLYLCVLFIIFCGFFGFWSDSATGYWGGSKKIMFVFYEASQRFGFWDYIRDK